MKANKVDVSQQKTITSAVFLTSAGPKKNPCFVFYQVKLATFIQPYNLRTKTKLPSGKAKKRIIA